MHASQHSSACHAHGNIFDTVAIYLPTAQQRLAYSLQEHTKAVSVHVSRTLVRGMGSTSAVNACMSTSVQFA